MVKYFSLQIKTTIRGNLRVALSSTFLVHLEKARHVIDFAHALHYSDVLRTRWVNNGCRTRYFVFVEYNLRNYRNSLILRIIKIRPLFLRLLI